MHMRQSCTNKNKKVGKSNFVRGLPAFNEREQNEVNCKLFSSTRVDYIKRDNIC